MILLVSLFHYFTDLPMNLCKFNAKPALYFHLLPISRHVNSIFFNQLRQKKNGKYLHVLFESSREGNRERKWKSVLLFMKVILATVVETHCNICFPSTSSVGGKWQILSYRKAELKPWWCEVGMAAGSPKAGQGRREKTFVGIQANPWLVVHYQAACCFVAK